MFDTKIYALKKVDLRNADIAAVRGYKREIDLLENLASVDRVVGLVEWELKNDRLSLSLVSNHFWLRLCLVSNSLK